MVTSFLFLALPTSLFRLSLKSMKGLGKPETALVGSLPLKVGRTDLVFRIGRSGCNFLETETTQTWGFEVKIVDLSKGVVIPSLRRHGVGNSRQGCNVEREENVIKRH